jgi:hypothetical protein
MIPFVLAGRRKDSLLYLEYDTPGFLMEIPHAFHPVKIATSHAALTFLRLTFERQDK